MSRDWRLYLDDILESCRRIRSYTTGLDQAGLVGNQLRCCEIWRSSAKRQNEFHPMFASKCRSLSGQRLPGCGTGGARLFPSECRHRLGRDQKQAARTGANSPSLSVTGVGCVESAERTKIVTRVWCVPKTPHTLRDYVTHRSWPSMPPPPFDSTLGNAIASQAVLC